MWYMEVVLVKSSQVKSIHVQKQQTTIRQPIEKPIECAPEARSGGRESMEIWRRGTIKRLHVINADIYVPSEKK